MESFWFLKVNGALPSKKSTTFGSSAWISNELTQYSKDLLDSLNNFTYIFENHLHCFGKETHDLIRKGAMVPAVRHDNPGDLGNEIQKSPSKASHGNDLVSFIEKSQQIKIASLGNLANVKCLEDNKNNSCMNNLILEKGESQASLCMLKKSKDASQHITKRPEDNAETGFDNKSECVDRNPEHSKEAEKKFKKQICNKDIESNSQIVHNTAYCSMELPKLDENCKTNSDLQKDKSHQQISGSLPNQQLEIAIYSDIKEKETFAIKEEEKHSINVKAKEIVSQPKIDIAKNYSISANQSLTLETVYLEEEKNLSDIKSIDKNLISGFFEKKTDIVTKHVKKDDSFENSEKYSKEHVNIEQVFKKNIKKDIKENNELLQETKIHNRKTERKKPIALSKNINETKSKEKPFEVMKDNSQKHKENPDVINFNQIIGKKNLQKTESRNPLAEKNTNSISKTRASSVVKKNQYNVNKSLSNINSSEKHVTPYTRKRSTFTNQIRMTNKFERKLGLNKLEKKKTENQQQTTARNSGTRYGNSNIISKGSRYNVPKRSQSLLNTETLINLKRKLNKTNEEISNQETPVGPTYSKKSFSKHSLIRLKEADNPSKDSTFYVNKIVEEKEPVKTAFRASKISLESLKRSFSSVNSMLEFSELNKTGKQTGSNLGIKKRPTRLNKSITSTNKAKAKEKGVRNRNQPSMETLSLYDVQKASMKHSSNEILTFNEESKFDESCSLKIDIQSKDWVKFDNLKQVLIMQKSINAHEIFGPMKNLNLDQIFSYQRKYC